MPEFQSMARYPALLAAMRSVFGAELLPDQGSGCRVAAPEHVIPGTATHCDADYMDNRSGPRGCRWLRRRCSAVRLRWSVPTAAGPRPR
jgi:hypothetical protein